MNSRIIQLCKGEVLNLYTPKPERTDGEASNPGPRQRQRGPRALDAMARRRARNTAEVDFVEQDIFDEHVCILHLNIQGFMSHAAKLTIVVRNILKKPTNMCLNETFLTSAIGEVFLEGYTTVARRDRADQWEGGVLIFAMCEFWSRVSLLETLTSVERIWAMIYSNRGPYLL